MRYYYRTTTTGLLQQDYGNIFAIGPLEFRGLIRGSFSQRSSACIVFMHAHAIALLAQGASETSVD